MFKKKEAIYNRLNILFDIILQELYSLYSFCGVSVGFGTSFNLTSCFVNLKENSKT